MSRAYKERHGSDRGFRGEPEEAGAIRLRVPDTGETVVSDVVRGEVAFPNVKPGRSRSSPGPTARRSTTSPSPSTTSTPASRTSCAARTTSPTPRSRCGCSRRWARRRREYAHLSLLYGPDGKKLSKRHGAASVQELREAGYLPEAVDNYIALLGAGFASDEEFFTLPELAERFRLERVSKNPAIFDEQKLRHIERPASPRAGHR